jgi:transposase
MGGLGTFDSRRLPAADQEDLRRRVVAALDAGMSQSRAADVFAVSRRAVGRWARAYRETGPEALRGHRRGRPAGVQFLSRRVQAELVQALAAGPEHPPALWCRRTVADLIETHTGVRLSLSAVGHYLARWDLTAPLGPRTAFADHATRTQVPGSRTVWIAWKRAVPRYLDDSLLPGPGSFATGPIPGRVGPAANHLELLTCQAARPDLHFLVAHHPWDPAALTDFGDRIVATLGHPVHLIVQAWPADRSEALRAWVSDRGPDVRVSHP